MPVFLLYLIMVGVLGCGFQLQLARRLTRSPHITAVVGQHVYVVQPIRFLHSKPVVFGEGNLISDQTTATGCCPACGCRKSMPPGDIRG